MSDNISDKISNTLLGTNDVSSIPDLTPDIDISGSSDSSMSSFFDWIKDISLTTWILIILILGFLGFNIFVYLAKGTQDVNDFFAPLVQKITSLFVPTYFNHMSFLKETVSLDLLTFLFSFKT